MQLSVVVPIKDEKDSLPELAEQLRRIFRGHDHEIILVDDGSRDGSWKVIEELSGQDEHIRAIRFRRNYGKSAALKMAFEQVEGDVVITMDADLQDSPDEIPGLYRMIAEEGYDLVSGWKQQRHDPISKTIPSKFFKPTKYPG